MPPVISFTSDFGLFDPYVGTVKAVMLAIAPGVTVVDICHTIEPQAITQAVFLTEQSWPYFAGGTVHLAVVDPGVGTARVALALRTPAGYVVGPDNGVLSAALPLEVRTAAADRLGRSSGLNATARLALPAGYEARAIHSPRVVRPEVSSTFHGRDVFGPAAAHLAAGIPFAEIGPPCRDVAVLPAFRADKLDGGLVGTVIHVDRFGNLISSIRAFDLSKSTLTVAIEGNVVPVVRTYAEADGLCALIGSGGFLEVALANGNAAVCLGLGVGAVVRVTAV